MNVVLAIVSLIGSLALPSLAVTIYLHVREQHRARADSVADRQRLLVERVLDAVERTMQRQASLARYVAAPPAVDFAALYPRVLLDVGSGNEAIAMWVWRQVQDMLATASQNQSIRLGGVIAAQLMSWQRGDIDVTWFSQELREHPVDQSFRVPTRVQLVQLRNWFGIGALFGALVASVTFVVRVVSR